jgi:hypothetical protein
MIESAIDFIARLAFVGVFVVECFAHIIDFRDEVENLVMPAIGFTLYQALFFHALTISLGLIGSIGFLVGSASNSAVITRMSLNLLLSFLPIITFVWWLKRDGV